MQKDAAAKQKQSYRAKPYGWMRQHFSYRFIVKHGRVTRLFSSFRSRVGVFIVRLIIITLSSEKTFVGVTLIHLHFLLL